MMTLVYKEPNVLKIQGDKIQTALSAE